MTLIQSVAKIIENSTNPLIYIDDSWKRIRFDEVAKVLNGFAFKSEFFSKDSGIPLIRIRDIGQGYTEINYFGEYDDRYIIRAGDLLVGMDGDFNVQTWKGEPALLNQRVCKISIMSPDYSFDFLKLVLPIYLKEINDHTSSQTVKHLSSKTINELLLPFPPKSTQEIIVKRIGELLSRVEVAKERLDRVPAIMQQFRQSVLAAACSGRLTEDWREKNQSSSSCLAQKELLFSPNQKLISIPESWKWYTFSDILDEVKNGIAKKPNLEPPGTPILRISAVRPGIVDLSDYRYSDEKPEVINKYILNEDDLLFTRYNGTLELVGICGRIKNLLGVKIVYPDKLIRVKVNQNIALNSFIELYFQTAHARLNIISSSKSSAGQKGISGKDLKSQPVPLPPINEQREIVRRVENIFSHATRIETRITAASEQIEIITQSILHQAFTGKLIFNMD